MDNKKLAAAMSAVFTYMKTSEEAAVFNAAHALESVNEVEFQLHQTMQPVNIWGISGRQAHMQANTMMQMRIFK